MIGNVIQPNGASGGGSVDVTIIEKTKADFSADGSLNFNADLTLNNKLLTAKKIEIYVYGVGVDSDYTYFQSATPIIVTQEIKNASDNLKWLARGASTTSKVTDFFIVCINNNFGIYLNLTQATYDALSNNAKFKFFVCCYN